MKPLKKGVLRFISIFLVFLAFATTALAAETYSADRAAEVPLKMQPGTIIVYTDTLEPLVIRGGYAQDEALSKTQSILPSAPILAKLPEDANAEDFAEIALENRIAIAQYEAITSGNYIKESPPVACPKMKVVYDETGRISNVYYPDKREPSGYSIHNAPGVKVSSETPNRTAASSDTTWSWGINFDNVLTYHAADDSFLGTGRATYFDDRYGNRDNELKPYDCATKMAYDYSKKGDQEVRIRNLSTDKVFTYHQADVGGLPDAIIDIWGLDNIHELAGNDSSTSANNVRYYHKRHSDQTIPTK